jgi:hypothetical protein
VLRGAMMEYDLLPVRLIEVDAFHRCTNPHSTSSVDLEAIRLKIKMCAQLFRVCGENLAP